MNEKECVYCKYFCTVNCPDRIFCYDKEDKPCFKLKPIYKSKITCEDSVVFYNINHFNWFQKLLGKIICKIKIEDV